jgi:hypothetical protein
VQQLLVSPMSLVMFGVFVLSLNLLLVSLVRRRRAAHAGASAGRPGRFGGGREK